MKAVQLTMQALITGACLIAPLAGYAEDAPSSAPPGVGGPGANACGTDARGNDGRGMGGHGELPPGAGPGFGVGPGLGPMMAGPGPGFGPMGGPGASPGPGFLHGIALSEDQQDKIYAIEHALEPSQRQHHRAVEKANEALRALVASGSFDEAKARTLAQTAGQEMAALALQRAQADAQMLAVLTPEQRAGIGSEHVLHPPRR